MKTYTIDGEHFSDMEGFYREMEELLVRAEDFEPGHNLNAFNDLLRGGFGMHEYGEPILIRWENYGKSKEDLGEEQILCILEVILQGGDTGHDCKLELYL